MAKIDLDSLSIEELAELRERANAKLLEKVASRQAELEAELGMLARYGKPAKKAFAAQPAPRDLSKTRNGESQSEDKGGQKADAAAKAA